MSFFGIVVLCVVSQIGTGLASPVDYDDVIRNSETLMAFMIHRHGDRTPTDDVTAARYSTNAEALLEATKPYGYGQLTEQGKQRAYRMGQFIRRRYNNFLSPEYNSSEIYIQSTDVTRTKMSVLTAMAAVYPAARGKSWSDFVNWEPVPYTTNSATYDPNMAASNCQVFYEYMTQTLKGPTDALSAYTEVLSQVSKALDNLVSLTEQPILTYVAYDTIRSQINMGIPVPSDLEAIMPEFQEAAGEAMKVLFGNLNNVNLLSGVLLKEFFQYSTAILNGEDTPRVRIYSAHDVNVYGFESILQLTPKQGVPKYSSLLSLELRRDTSGKVFVLPVYLPTPEEPEMYLQVQGCDSIRCSFDQFTDINYKYSLDIDNWRTLCNWSENTLFQ